MLILHYKASFTYERLVLRFHFVFIYTVSQKTRHQTLGHNFTNYYPILKIFSLADLAGNVQQIYV